MSAANPRPCEEQVRLALRPAGWGLKDERREAGTWVARSLPAGSPGTWQVSGTGSSRQGLADAHKAGVCEAVGHAAGVESKGF